MKARENSGNKKAGSAANIGVLRTLSVSLLIAVAAEFLLFNISSLKSLGCEPVVIAKNVCTDGSGVYEVYEPEVNTDVINVNTEITDIVNAEYAEVSISLTDEGDAYEYDLPSSRVVPGVKGSGHINIYPYGKTGSLRVRVSVSEGAKADIAKITVNARKPLGLKPLRILISTLILCLLIYVFKYGFCIPVKRNNRCQAICIAVLFVMLTALGRKMSVSDPLMVSCPWPHHKQYQQLAHALDEGKVQLDMEADPRLLAKDNPYDTSALLKEEIPYGMDYAFYDGKYYVYFGIVPELLLYYPFYKLTGRDLANYNADIILYMILIAGVLLSVREIIFRFASDGKVRESSKVPFVIYVLMCVGICLGPGTVYLISKPDIYNIPIMAATAFTFLGTGLWLYADQYDGKMRTVFIALGSLCMALVAGCRPQMLIFGLPAIFIFVFKGGTDGRLSVKNRRIFIKGRLGDTLAFCLPYIFVAVAVCAYNMLRFGNILDFGATYSLTSNDMNHRGFNLDRLFRGLYCFLFQPPVIKTDFPFIESAVIESSYMGKNLTEYTYGGVFALCPVLLALFVPVFARIKGVSREAKLCAATLTSGALITAAFDVNGAGILIRYTCDMLPGLLIAAVIVWSILYKEKEDATVINRLYAVATVIGLAFAVMVFFGTEGSINLRDNAVKLYESAGQYFVW